MRWRALRRKPVSIRCVREILANGEYADDVRRQEAFYAAQGIRAVPSVILNDRHLIQGGQPPELFERALRELAEQQGRRI